jgi:S-adenosylmethionine:tRNA ribosyltransferase-isomerase
MKIDLKKSDFYYELPAELIAHYPTAERSASRLLSLEGKSGKIQHRQFKELPELLNPGDLLVFNNTYVVPARLHGNKDSGGKVELLVERIINEQRFLAHIRASKTPKPGSTIRLDNDVIAVVEARHDDLYELSFHGSQSVIEVLEAIGHIPLPPYINRPDEEMDKERYQTIYANRKGAVAAPTAGLHFDQAILDRLTERGIQQAFVTLHVGAGTFQPVRVDDLSQHIMHSEYAEISAEVCELVRQTKANGKRVIAVGTTTTRVLETAAQSGTLQAFKGDTQLFIKPGYRFHCVDAMVTNFHLPESTLLMLLCAFAGYETVMKAYDEAVTERYRFYSYGDAMLVTPLPYGMICPSQALDLILTII